MANTNSWAFPKMFDIARNRVSLIEDNTSVVNRVKLLMLTQKTELYNEPNFGVGLKQHLFKYNTENEKAIMLHNIKEQVGIHDPSVDAPNISMTDGLLFTGSSSEIDATNANRLEVTIGLPTVYGDTIETDTSDM